MNRVRQILSDYDGIVIVAGDLRFSGFFRKHEDCAFRPSARHNENTPWVAVPWIMRHLTIEEHGPICNSPYYAIGHNTWMDIAKLYGHGKIMTDCPLVFAGTTEMFAIDASAPSWHSGVSEIYNRDFLP